MPKFSAESERKLMTCCPELQEVFRAVIEVYDCTVIEGHRTRAEQDEYFRTGRSKLEWPHSKHNSTPSEAADVGPYPIQWNNTKRFYHFAGFVVATGRGLGHRIRSGADWDGDFDLDDQVFMDLVHFEYAGPAWERYE